jgi:hypothetical protein
MSALRIVPLAACALVGLAGGAAGQVAASLDVGAGTYRPDRAIPGGIASIAPTLVYHSGLFQVGGAGVYSDAPGGRWNFQATTFAGMRTPRWGIFEAEANGQIDVTRHFAVRGSTALTGELRLSAHPFRGASIWAGHGIGVASALDSRRPLRRSQIGTSARLGGIELGFSVASTTFDLMNGLPLSAADSSRSLPIVDEAAARSPSSHRRSLTDAMLSSKWRIADFDLDVALGRRFSRSAPEMTIWGVSASRGITPQLALVAGAGRSGADPVTSVPGSRYFVLGLRLKVGPPAGIVLAPRPRTAEHTPFRIGPALPAGREVVVRAPSAAAVELAGDFTDWRPVPLERADGGAWRAVLPIAPGLHRLAIRIDQGEWRAPPGARPVPSEFGGEVAEVVVE